MLGGVFSGGIFVRWLFPQAKSARGSRAGARRHAGSMLRVAARAAACSGAGAAALSRRNMASSAGSTSVHSFSGTLLDGRPLQLATLAGRPALIVNVASE